MSQPYNTNSSIAPPLTEILCPLLILSSVVMCFFPMPGWILDVGIGLGITLTTLILMTSLYTRRPSTYSSLPAIIILSVLGRTALSIAFIRRFFMNGEFAQAAQDTLNGNLYSLDSTPFNFNSLLVSVPMLETMLPVILLASTSLIVVMGIKWLASGMAIKSRDILRTTSDSDRMADAEACIALNGSISILLLESIAGLVLTGAIIWLCESLKPVLPFAWGAKDFASAWIAGYSIIITSEILIRQFPILITALSVTLVIVCPSASQAGNVPKRFFEELIDKPYGVLFAAFFILMTGAGGLLGTGMHWWIFFPLGIALTGIAFSVFLASDCQFQRRMLDTVQQQREEAEKQLQAFQEPAICLEYADNLQKLFHIKWPLPMPDALLQTILYAPKGARLAVNKTKKQIKQDIHCILSAQEPFLQLRRELFEELGYMPPPIHFRQSQQLSDNQARLLIQGMPALAMTLTAPEDSDCKTAVDSLAVYASQIKSVLIEQNERLLTRKDIQDLLNLASKEDPALVEQVLSYFDLDILRQLIIQLIQHKKSIRNFNFILESLCQYGPKWHTSEHNLPVLVAHLEQALSYN